MLDVVLDGVFRDPVGAAEPDGGQVVRLHEAVHRHSGEPHDFRDFGNGEETGIGKTFSGHCAQLSWGDVVHS